MAEQTTAKPAEGSLEAPTRFPIDWKNPDFYNEKACLQEMERVFDICHGCRRCVNLCRAFPQLFDLVDESPSFEVDGVEKQDYWKVVDHCYLCDLCYMSKCPYVPPHEWNIDFPHLMLRAKAIKFKKKQTKLRDRTITSTDAMGKLLSIPVISQTVNTLNKSKPLRKVFQSLAAIHAEALLPPYANSPFRKRYKDYISSFDHSEPTSKTTGKIALFTTCYANYNEPSLAEDLIKIYEHNEIKVTLLQRESCCGMPKFELGDLQAVDQYKRKNIPEMLHMISQGWDIVAPVPSCVLMFKQELPLMYPDDEDVAKVKKHIFDPFEYLMLRHKEGKFKNDFKNGLGNVAYQVACHQRVQNMGAKTREVLQLVPDTKVDVIERCSGHDGTYAVKEETHVDAMKIVRPVVKRIKDTQTDSYTSDCAMAARHIQNALQDGSQAVLPMRLLRDAYGI